MVVHLNPNISITTLSINAINAPVKRNIMLYFFNPVMLIRDQSLKQEKVERKKMEKIFYILICILH